MSKCRQQGFLPEIWLLALNNTPQTPVLMAEDHFARLSALRARLSGNEHLTTKPIFKSNFGDNSVDMVSVPGLPGTEP